jgi:hypothetical protein
MHHVLACPNVRALPAPGAQAKGSRVLCGQPLEENKDPPSDMELGEAGRPRDLHIVAPSSPRPPARIAEPERPQERSGLGFGEWLAEMRLNLDFDPATRDRPGS